MYFHQDDLDWLLMVDRPVGQVMALPIGDHINYLFKLFFSLEWRVFGFNFPPYLAMSVIMHSIVVWLIYLLAKATSGRVEMGVAAALLFSINTNWTEVVLWVSGQTISFTALLVLLAMLAIWQRKYESWMLLLTSWTSALSVGLLGASMVVRRQLRTTSIAVLILVGLFYLLRGGEGTTLEISLKWLWQVLVVAVLMPIHTVVGRVLIPFDVLEMPRLVIAAGAICYGLWRGRRSLTSIWQDSWSRFLLCHLALYYLVVAIGRAQYGIGIMRAERYGYIGLAIILLLLARILRKVELKRWKLIVMLILCGQMLGFYQRARAYIERPQQLRSLVEEIQAGGLSVNDEAYLPRYVMGSDRLRYSDLKRLIND